MAMAIGGFIYAIRNKVDVNAAVLEPKLQGIRDKIDANSLLLEPMLTAIREDIVDLKTGTRMDVVDIKDDLKKLNAICIKLAEQDGRMQLQAERMNNMDKRLEERVRDAEGRFAAITERLNLLARGESMILPIHKSPYETPR
jgi:hypothetical protein